VVDILATLAVAAIIYLGCKLAGNVFANEYKKGVQDGMLEFARQLREHDLYIDMMISHEGGTKEIRLTAKKDGVKEYREDVLQK
jgi:hypothetical protein